MARKNIDLGFEVEQLPPKPQVQILGPRESPKEQQIKYCSKCNLKIEWLPTNRRWICYSCGVTYSEFDTPLANIDQQIHPLQSNSPYERIEPAFISIKPNTRLEGEDKGNKHIQVSGSYHRANIKTDTLALVLSERDIRRYFESAEDNTI